MRAVLEGRTAIVTGGSQGFGRAIAEAYVDAGAQVVVAARSQRELDETVEALISRCGDAGRVLAVRADVSLEDDAERLVADSIARFGTIEILVNNAGIYGPMGAIETVDWAAWVQAININLMGSVLMARALVPHLRARRYGKIVQVSGGGATAPLPRLSAYAASKAAVVRFAETLAEELREDHIDVNSIAPGALNTRLLDEVLAAGPERVGQQFYDRAVRQAEEGGAPIDRGVALAVYLGSAASDGVTAKLLSALWDPWAGLADHRDALDASDVYTLRRIVPEDRDLALGAEGQE
jgi:NAD(P)-dependent dehydrogenase (short-subunit alcohol dehydrogenase family)